jgi:hypothetical protein
LNAKARQLVTDILSGRYWCLYEVLELLLGDTAAKTVSMLRGGRRSWRIVHEVAVDSAYSIGGLDVATLPAVLRLRARMLPGAWWHPEVSFDGRTVRCFVTRVVVRPFAPEGVESSVLVIVEPHWLPLDPVYRVVAENAEWVTKAMLAWFARQAHLRDEREWYLNRIGLSEAAEDRINGLRERLSGVPEADRDRWIAANLSFWDENLAGLYKTLSWPIPSESLIRTIDGITSQHPAGAAAAGFWQEVALERLCHGYRADPSGCRLQSHSQLCAGSEDRRRLGDLAEFLKWRSPVDTPLHGGLLAEIRDSIEALPEPTVTPPLGSNAPRHLGGRFLIQYFIREFWARWLPNRFAFGLGHADESACVTAATHLWNYVDGSIPVDEQVIESLIWAVTRFAEDVVKVERRLDVRSHLLHAARNEPALHVLKEFYRDHFFHALEVCFLGHYLLMTAIDSSGTPLIRHVRRKMKVTTDEDVLREWYVASLIHDVGYGVDVIIAAVKMLQFHKRSEPLTRLRASINDSLDEFARTVATAAGADPGSSLPRLDHGAAGAEHLRCLMRHIRRRKPGDCDYERAAGAIADHSHYDQTVSFSGSPLGVLLIICDGIQEWNRAHLRFGRAPAALLTRLAGGRPIEPSVNNGGECVVRVRSHRGGGRPLLEFSLRYAESINKNAGVFNAWLDLASNFQRLELDGFPFDVRVIIHSPLYRRNGFVESQMERLIAASEETHMRFLEPWFPSRGNTAVRHRVSAGYDVLVYDVAALSVARPISATMETFWKLYSRWRRASEDRDLIGDYAPEPPG